MDTKTNTSGTSPEVDILMKKVLKGTADRNDISLLREWLSESEDNQRLFKQKCAVTEVFEPNFNPDDIDTEKALSKIHRQMRKSVAWRKFASHFAAAVIPLLCVAALYFFVPGRGAQEDVAVVSLSTPYGGMLQTVLPDSSRVWLNANSTLEYPAVFDMDERKVILEGEGYFEVRADKAHPFIVSTDNVDVVATGTAFNVNAYTKSSVDVTLLEGLVDVKLGDNRAFTIRPGEKLSLKDNAVEILKESSNHKSCSWKNGVLIFDNDRLDIVFARLSQIYPVDFIIKDNAFAQTRYHATFSCESIYDIIHLLEIAVPMRCIPVKNGQDGQRMTYEVYPE